MQLSQVAKIVSCVAPIDTAGTARRGARINMSKYNHVTFICTVGVTNAAVQTITVESAATSVAAGTAMDFNYREATTGGPLISVLEGVLESTTAAVGIIVTQNADDDKVYCIEVDAAELPVRARQYVGITFSDTATVCMVSCVAVCCEPRYYAAPPLMPDPTVA